jgi:hypothetical protein
LPYYSFNLSEKHISKNDSGALKRGGQPLFLFFPPTFEGEGDTGGEVKMTKRKN